MAALECALLSSARTSAAAGPHPALAGVVSGGFTTPQQAAPGANGSGPSERALATTPQQLERRTARHASLELREGVGRKPT